MRDPLGLRLMDSHRNHCAFTRRTPLPIAGDLITRGNHMGITRIKSGLRPLVFATVMGLTLVSAMAATTPTITLTPKFTVTQRGTIRPGTIQQIEIRDGSGKPVKGVTVVVGWRPARTNAQFNYAGAAMSDANGDASFSVYLPVGEYQFQAYAPGTNSKTIFWTVISSY